MDLSFLSKEPIPKVRELGTAILFWGAIAAFVFILLVLLDQAVEEKKSYQKPVNLGMHQS
ncbi:MAG: hypothetical protein AAF571_05570 [Verrucomicrobiota bacterium]